MTAPDDELTVQVTLTLDRRGLAELAAALVPFVSKKVHADLLQSLDRASWDRPPTETILRTMERPELDRTPT